MQNYRFDHVHLYSPEPVKTAEFYEKVFGAENHGVRQDPDGRTIVDLVLNGIEIKVSVPRAGGPQEHYGLDHFGLVTDNLEAAVAELKAKGIEFVQEITSLPTADISFLLAPEGTVIEVLEKKG